MARTLATRRNGEVAGPAMDRGLRIATIDVGSNSIHMLIAQVEADGRIQVLDRAKELVGLGRRTLATGRLSKRAMAAGLRTLAAFRLLADRREVTRIRAVATSALREAANGGEFLERIEEEVGIRIRVIPGREEARLTFLGARQAVDLRGAPSLILDLGGGSVELILVEDEKPAAMHSLRLGAVRLAEAYLRSDPPTAAARQRLTEHLEERLEPVLAPMADRGVRRVIGTSGTMLNLAEVASHRMGVDPAGHRNNLQVAAAEVTRLRRMVEEMDRTSRLRLRGLEPSRVDLLPVGAVMADLVIRRLGAEQLVACTWSLREGVLVDYIARHRPGIQEAWRYADVRRRSVARLARHLGQDESHPRHVARLALRLLEQLGERLGLEAADAELLEHAALLHDVGRRIGHRNHERHTRYLIANGELMGFTREEVEVIAMTARYHRKGLPRRSDRLFDALPRKARRKVRALAALLRLADGLDRSHYGVVRDVRTSVRGGRLLVRLATEGEDAALEIWEARGRAALLERLLGLPLSLRIAS